MTLKEDSLYANQSYTFQVEKKKTDCIKLCQEKQMEKRKRKRKIYLNFPLKPEVTRDSCLSTF